MEHLDKLIAKASLQKEQKERTKKTWEKELSEITENIPKLQINLDDEEIKMKQVSLFDDNISIYMPKDFKEMTLDDKKDKYSTEPRPQIMYQNNKDTINIGFSIVEIDEPEEELLKLRDEMKEGFLSLNPSSEIYDEGDFMSKESQIAYYAFNSFALGGQMFNLIFITFIDEKILMCNLNCLKKDMDKQKLLLYGIMKTVEIKNNTLELQKPSELQETSEPQKVSTPLKLAEKDELLKMPVISTLIMEYSREQRPVNVFICKNEKGETPINNMYALKENGEFAWIVHWDKDDIKCLNNRPFIAMERRGYYAVVGIEKGVGEVGFCVNPRDGRIMKTIDIKELIKEEGEKSWMKL